MIIAKIYPKTLFELLWPYRALGLNLNVTNPREHELELRSREGHNPARNASRTAARSHSRSSAAAKARIVFGFPVYLSSRTRVACNAKTIEGLSPKSPRSPRKNVNAVLARIRLYHHFNSPVSTQRLQPLHPEMPKP